MRGLLEGKGGGRGLVMLACWRVEDGSSEYGGTVGLNSAGRVQVVLRGLPQSWARLSTVATDR